MTPSPLTDPLIGRLVDERYRVRARIARGGMATVYVATDLRLERRIALKVMHQHLSDDAVFQSRFIQEARAAARLADPHVVNVFDQGQDGELAYMVMEYLPGITLRELMREQRRLSVTQTITIMDAILSGLAAAHRAGIVHRDVKPENVLLAEDGRIKIGDFGLARATTANTATGQQLMGTIAYLAPELVTRGTADARSDIYALGIMLYEMLAGEQPYRGEQPMQIAYQHAMESVPRPSVKNPGVPEQLDELVLWSTEREPDERPLDAQVMLDRLREIEHELGVTPVITRRDAAAQVGLAIPEDANTGGVTTVMPVDRTTRVHTRAIDLTDNATRLRAVSRKNRKKGAWLTLMTLLVAVVATGIGWYFGSGPGAQIAIPHTSGQSAAAAEQALKALELSPKQQTEASSSVEAGTVIRTDPKQGARVDRKTSVTVFVSSGPKEVTFEALGGQERSAVEKALTAQSVKVSGTSEQFNNDVAAGNVLGVSLTPANGSAAVDCTPGCTAHEGDSASLTVSLGPVADVTGMSAEKARSQLTGQGLKVASPDVEEYSDTVAAGTVIRQGAAEGDSGAWVKGDTVVLTVSKGPQPVAVPNIIGLSIGDAVAKLESVGLRSDATPGVLGDVWKVRAIDHEVGSLQPPGTIVKFTSLSMF